MRTLFFSYENNFLNGDGQQFHQYQQNEQALITSIYQTQIKGHNIWSMNSGSCSINTGLLCGGNCNMKYLNVLLILAFSENLWYAAVN